MIGADEQGSPTSSRHVAADRLLVGGARAQLDRGDADAKRAVVARVGDVRVAQQLDFQGGHLWLTYRTFSLKRPLRLTWPLLYRQFGVDSAKAND